MKLARCLIAMLLACAAAAAGAQGWSPQKNVELVVPNPPGGSNDKTARTVERIWSMNKVIPSTLSIVKRAGGGGSIAYTYVSQRTGDPHFLVVAGPALLTNHITGASKLRHTDLTPVASLFNDYTAYAVNVDSPIKTGKDLIERLRKDPKSVTIGFSPLLGSHNHIAAGLLMKAVGGNARDLKVVAYKGSADAIPNLMGGHIDLITTAPATSRVTWRAAGCASSPSRRPSVCPARSPACRRGRSRASNSRSAPGAASSRPRGSRPSRPLTGRAR